MKPEFPLDPALDFLQHLWAVNHALERMSLQMERKLGITAQQRLMLRCVGKYPGVTGTQLATVLHLDRGTVSVSLRRLVEKGFVKARREKDDQRRVALTLTTRGRALDRPAAGTVEHVVERLLSKVGGAPVQRTKQVLQLLSEELTHELEG